MHRGSVENTELASGKASAPLLCHKPVLKETDMETLEDTQLSSGLWVT